MSRRDPFSTPARRRRIIAEMAKKTLKFYCVAACNNVFVFREHTVAAIRLQCGIRTFVARRKVFRLRFERKRKASTKIQAVVRSKLAKLLRKRLEAALLLKRRTRLAEVVNNLRNARKQRMAWVAFLIARKLAREKKEAAAALYIQRVGRGMLARLYYKKLYKAHQAYLLRRRQAAIRIQSQVRRRSAVKRCLYWSTRRKAAYMIYNNVMRWWVRRRYIRKRCSLRIQRIIRGHQGRDRFKKRWQEREEVRAQMATAILASTELDVLQELILRTAQEMLPQEKCMCIHVDIDEGLMEQLADKGAGHVVLWCLSNSILDYRRGHGYRAGAVVQQVVRSVDQALHTENIHQMDAAAKQQHGAEKVIALQKWDEGDTADIPEDFVLPGAWSQLSYEAGNALRGAKQPNVGAGVCAELLSERRIELHITTVTNNGNHYDERHTPFLRSTVTIVFNALAVDTAVAASDNPANPLSTENTSSSKRDVNELKFRFKNALVFVNNPTPPVPVAAPEPESEVAIEVDEDSSDMSGDEEEAELVAEVVEVVPEVRPRPSTAVVRIVLREPTTPPPPIDFDAKAAIIQKRARLLYRHKVRLVTRLQRSVRRMRRVAVWQELVYTLLEVAHDAATIVQCWLRRAAAQRKLAALRDAYERAHYGHDFTVDEAANWAAFGLLVDVNDAISDAIYRNPIVSVAVPDVKQLEIQHSLASSEVRQLRQVISTLQPPPASDVLRLIGFPPPPPGCVYPTFDSVKLETAADGTSNILMMLPLPPDTYGVVSGTSTTIVPGADAVPALGPLSHTASMRERAFRTWAEQCLSNAPTAPSKSIKSGAISRSPNEDLSGYRRSHLLGNLRMELGVEHQESCGDLVNRLAQDQLVDSIRQNHIGSAITDSYADAAPIYKVLAAKFL